MNNYILPEAGGAAAISGLQFLLDTDISKYSISVSDMDSSVIKYWNLPKQVDTLNIKNYVPVPTDEYSRLNDLDIKQSYINNPIFSNIEMALFNNKSISCNTARNLKHLKFPYIRRGKSVRSRPILGAGSKDHTIYTSPSRIKNKINNIFTYNFTNDYKTEYVIDFYVNNDKTYGFNPREVLSLKNGADNYIKFISDPNKLELFNKIILEVIEKFNWFGIGNLQILEDIYGNMWFIEISARLSGTSWINIKSSNYNPIHLMLNNLSYYPIPCDDSYYLPLTDLPYEY